MKYQVRYGKKTLEEIFAENENNAISISCTKINVIEVKENKEMNCPECNRPMFLSPLIGKHYFWVCIWCKIAIQRWKMRQDKIEFRKTLKNYWHKIIKKVLFVFFIINIALCYFGYWNLFSALFGFIGSLAIIYFLFMLFYKPEDNIKQEL